MTETGFNTVYLLLGLGLTTYGARMVLFTGRVFLQEAFQQNAELVRAMSHVLAVSFCLGMGGFLFMAADFFPPRPNPGFLWNAEMMHFGALILFMSVELFFHLFLLSQMRGRGRRQPDPDTSLPA